MLVRHRQPPFLIGFGLVTCLALVGFVSLRPVLSGPPPTVGFVWPGSSRPDLGPSRVPAAAQGAVPAHAAQSAVAAPPPAAVPAEPTARVDLVSPVALAVAGDLLLAADISRDQVLARPLLGGPWVAFAGSGFAGYTGDGGAAVSAGLSAPEGLAVDRLGNVYIADSSNHAIRKVSSDGSIQTVAGSGLRGFAGDSGPATAARLDSPAGVAVGADGSFYIADKGNNRIRRVDPSGLISTVAGSGRLTVVAGSGGFGFSGDGGPAVAAQLSAPEGVLAGPDGRLYIADTGNDRVRLVTPSGVIQTIAGSGRNGHFGDGGAATAAGMTAPVGLALDGRGRILVSERDGQVVRLLAGGLITAVAGTGRRGTGPGDLDDPSGLALAGGALYVAETGAGRVAEIALIG